MEVQTIIVTAIIVSALLYAGIQIRKKSRSFSKKSGCGVSCGCTGSSKKLIS